MTSIWWIMGCCSALCSPQPLSTVSWEAGGLLCPLWAQESGVVWKWVMEVVGASRVVHSDPAATIKIGGVRCLHSYLCKSHQPEPFLFLAAGYIIIRLAGNCSGWWGNMVFAPQVLFFFSCSALHSGSRSAVGEKGQDVRERRKEFKMCDVCWCGWSVV